MKKYSLPGIFSLLFVAVILFFSCKKDLSTENSIIVTDNTDLTTKINTSVSGFVTDENNQPASGVVVTAGTGSTTTDQFGYFEIKNVQLVKNAAFVTVNKTGYFKGIKTWIATETHTAFFRIKLLPKTNAGTVSGNTGGDIILAGGMKVSFPASSFVNASTGAAYPGAVTVSAKWLDPTATDLSNTMPGDLRGKDASGSIKLLTTYGMAAIELTGSSNELLQIAPGKKATLTMPIPASMTGTAPATIPLWYFDETTGLWKEDGSAVKTGNNYVGDVTHFTYWNCDAPGPTVQVTFRVMDNLGNPMPNASLIIVPLTGYGAAHGYTDDQGYVTGPVPANAQLQLNIVFGCNSMNLAMFTTTNVNLDLGTITFTPDPALTAHVSGAVTDCSGAPVANGRVYFVQSRFSLSSYPVNNGIYSFTTSLCGSSALTGIAEDLSNMQQSMQQQVPVTGGSSIVANFQACGNTATEYLNYTLNGTTHSFASPIDYLGHYHFNNGSVISTYGQSDHAYLNFSDAGLAVGSFEPVLGFSLGASSDSLVMNPGSLISVTEYGNVGQHIAGNFSGTAYKYINPSITFPVTFNFRVIRGY